MIYEMDERIPSLLRLESKTTIDLVINGPYYLYNFLFSIHCFILSLILTQYFFA